MTHETLGQLLLLFLLAISCGRVLFLHTAREDSLSVLPGAILLLSVLNICAFGLGIFSIAILFLAFFVFVWNVRARLRFKAHLIVDHYSALFISISLFNLVLVLAVSAAVIYCRPVKINIKKMGVTKTRTYYTGTFKDGFFETPQPLRTKSLIVYTYRKKESLSQKAKENGRQCIFFVPSECATVAHYEPILAKLAADGFDVFAADFSSRDDVWLNRLYDMRPFRRFIFCTNRLFRKNQYETDSKNAISHFTRELYALLEAVPTQQNDTLYVVSDSPVDIALLGKSTDPVSLNVYHLDSYKTKGWGVIEETEPILSYLVCGEKDTSLYISASMTGELEQQIRNAGKKGGNNDTF